ncbi:DUF4227 family protein [Alteribacillus sp. HJP-4]|uniref:DUF4227 family protein n=1 Tax=Alteribacillus sp. HJP-4 TaxID=2775394 RepID=UPI0035CCCEAF
MKVWISYMADVMKLFIVFIICIFVFYYGIVRLSEEYEADERLKAPEKEAEQVYQMEMEDKGAE